MILIYKKLEVAVQKYKFLMSVSLGAIFAVLFACGGGGGSAVTGVADSIASAISATTAGVTTAAGAVAGVL